VTRALSFLVLGACAHGIPASAPEPLPPAHATAVDTSPKARPRMVPPEVYLRAYLTWFGGLAPLDVQARAKGKQLFDAWDDYLNALGLPDYRLDLPRQAQTNSLMLATFGRLGEALCVRAAEHDLHRAPAARSGSAGPRSAAQRREESIEQRVVFAFEPARAPSEAQFAAGFDVLHRTFLGYPAKLAPDDRIARFYQLYQAVAARHVRKQPLTADETAWAAVCAALVQHPETELY